MIVEWRAHFPYRSHSEAISEILRFHAVCQYLADFQCLGRYRREILLAGRHGDTSHQKSAAQRRPRIEVPP